MPDLYGYDFSDELIRDLVRVNHVPVEDVETTSQGTTLRPVLCVRCRAHWPCDPITELRAWQLTNGYDVLTSVDAAPTQALE